MKLIIVILTSNVARIMQWKSEVRNKQNQTFLLGLLLNTHTLDVLFKDHF